MATYAGSGFGLMLVKYCVEAVAIFCYTDQVLTPWSF